MKRNRVLEKLRRGEPTYGTWLSMGDISAARVLSRVGFDWLTLDMEHSPIDWSQAAAVFAVVAEAGCVPLVRVPEGSHHYIKRVLDAGAMGIVVPMVDTVEQAKIAIAAAKYPPIGNRSVGGTLHTLNYGATASDYFEHANDEIAVILQTESPRGIANAEAIYSLPGCDAIFIGPNDLRFQMRKPDGTFPTPEEHEAAIQAVIAMGKKTGTPTGVHAMSAEEAVKRAGEGMQFLAIGSDLRFVTLGAQAAAKICYPEGNAKDIARY